MTAFADYQLTVDISAGHVTVSRQATGHGPTEAEAERVAAQIVDHLTADESARIEPPPPGVAVLACACGAVLDAADMHRRRGRHPGGPPIARITCCDCSGDGGRRA